MVTIVDYGLGNLGSIHNMLRKLGHEAHVASDPHAIAQADRIILPGVGAFDQGMGNLRRLGLLEVLNQKVLEEKTPVLGICLGAQLMTRGSEEGAEPGLGWVEAATVRFFGGARQEGLKVPHMGWGAVLPRKVHDILEGADEELRFYFVHTYHFKCDNEEDILAMTRYGCEFPSAFAVGNIVGVQFHPEKSHKYGMRLLSNFAKSRSLEAVALAT